MTLLSVDSEEQGVCISAVACRIDSQRKPRRTRVVQKEGLVLCPVSQKSQKLRKSKIQGKKKKKTFKKQI